MFASALHVVVALLAAPLLPAGITRVKARFAGRQGPPLLQPYYDLAKLLRKGAVISTTTTWVFRAGPVVTLATACAALLLIPFGGAPAPLAFTGDLFVLAYLLARLALLGALVLALVLVLAWWRRRLLAARTVYAPTWATAYAAPNPRMQYTAASFAAPLTNLFHPIVRLHAEVVAVTGYFAEGGSYHTRARGLFVEPVFGRVFSTVAQAAGRLRWLQHGRVQLYLVNIGATLVALLIWELGIAP